MPDSSPPLLSALSPADLLPKLRANTADVIGWLRTDSFEALLGVGAALLLYLLFVAIRIGLLKLIGAGHEVTTWRGFLWRVVRRTRSFFLAMLAANIVVHALAPPGGLMRAIEILFTVAIAMQAAFWVREIVIGAVERRAGITAAAAGEHDAPALASALGIIKVLVNVVVWSLALILVLSNLGVDVTALVAGLGVGGIAIGLAAQGIFGDLFAALAILFDRPFKVGDSINFGGTTGTVEAIGLKTTRVRALAGEQIIVSNRNLLDQQIANNRRVIERRVVTVIGLIYQTPPGLLERVPGEIKAIVEASEHTRFDRAHFTTFNASSLDFEIVYHVTSPDYGVMMDERHRIGLAILRRFDELGIDFAYPSQIAFTAGRDGRIVDPVPREAVEEAPEEKPQQRPRMVRS